MNEGKIRVLHVIRHMNTGGAETLIMNLYRNVDREKIQFDFLVFGDGIFDKEINQLGGKIYYMKYLTEIGQIKFKKNLIEFFKTHREYKIVHSHIDQVSGIILEAAKKAEVPVRISHSHSTGNSNNCIAKIYKKILQTKINKNANVFFACSENAAKWLFKKMDYKAYIINNGIDTEKFAFSEENRKQIREEFNIKDGTEVIGHVGSLIPVKNHKFILEVFEEYIKMRPNTVLMLVGNGRLKEKLKQDAKNLNIEKNIFFTGIRSDVQKFYSAFDMFIFPSLYEGISTALIEAQTNGLTIFASSAVDSKTDITNTINFIDLKDSAENWAKKIKRTDIKRYNNIEKIKENGFDIKEIARNLEKKYYDLYYRKEEYGKE